MQLSTQSRKRLLFAALFLAILIPLFFTLAIRSQLPLLGFEGGSPLIDWVHQNTTGSGFLRKVTGDATCDRARSALGDAVLQKELSHTVYDRLYDFVRAHLPGHHGRLRHQLAGGGILRPDALGRLSAGGARPRLGTRLSDCRRLLFCQPCVQPQGGIRQSPTFPQQRKTARSPAPFFAFPFSHQRDIADTVERFKRLDLLVQRRFAVHP